MGLRHRVERIELARGASAPQRAASQRRASDLIASIARDRVRHAPEYLAVRRGDCADDEAWREVQRTIALARGDLREADRLRAFWLTGGERGPSICVGLVRAARQQAALARERRKGRFRGSG
jgi:hypothetical protein